MKKIVFLLASIALIALGACSNGETQHETTGAVPAKIVNDNVTEITVSEDSALSAEEAFGEDLDNLREDAENVVSDNIEAARENAEELKDKASEKIEEKKDAVKEAAADKLEEAAHKLEN
ncbi:MAG: hypothetical protein NC402_06650 [Prevotella sp.]|nr:hypothetical protein [Prevotella sp.]MCM1075392.1 hypothetical protein [Ruminococcus sp.]